MKRFLIFALGSMLAGSLAFANSSSKHEEKDKHNPITGSDTHESVTEKKVKGKDGSSAKLKVKKSTTKKADGGTETESSTKESHEPAD